MTAAEESSCCEKLPTFSIKVAVVLIFKHPTDMYGRNTVQYAYLINPAPG